MTHSPEIIAAAHAICREMGLDPDAVTSSAYGAPQQWVAFIPHARAAAAVYAESFRAMAEIARQGAMLNADQIQAERLFGRANALHEAADILGEKGREGNVVEFKRRF